jgi:DNA-binding MarR family transcriptional regulator
LVKLHPNNPEDKIQKHQILSLLRLTADAAHRVREFELQKYGISPQQAAALICIHSLHDQATPAELSRWLFREPNSITILLNRMHKLGFIEKKADTKKRNQIRLSLTPKGYETYLKATEFKSFDNLLNVFPKSKRKQLCNLLMQVKEDIFQELRLDSKAYSRWLDKAAIFNKDRAISQDENQLK